MLHKRAKANVCFILDATSSNQSIFTLASLYFFDIAFDVRARSRKLNGKNIQYGAVVYRDPIDYIPIPTGISDIIEEERKAEND